MKRSGSGVHVFQLAFNRRRAFSTHTLVMFDICTDVHFESHMSVRLFIVDTFVLGVTSPHIPLQLLQALTDFI